MVSPSRVGRLVALLVAAGCSANSSGEHGQTGSTQASGSSTSGSGTQNASGSVASGSSSGSGVTGETGSNSGASGAVSATGSSGVTSGVASGGGSGSTGTGASGDGTSGSSGQASGSDGGATGVGTEAGTSSAGPFTCTLVVGLFTTSQWFSGMMPGGASKTFLMDGVDATKWEGKQTKYAYIEKWEDPTNTSVWGLPLANPCATNSATPDRVVFVGFSPGVPADQDYGMYSKFSTDEMGWETLLNSVIATIKGKYPSAKEIDILTMGRAPNNMLCSNNNDVDTIIQPYEDAAYDAVAAASGGFVVVGPKYYVPDCGTSYIFANDSDYTTTAANAIATQVAAYYVAHP